ncbi:MAG: hypothetical protein H6745_16405 [Deltaproteobacteria bacterium]|nr:hypothetical protein [Deltaproteobacteria bacterium]
MHELGVVASVSGTAVTLVRPLAETYAAAGNGSPRVAGRARGARPHFGSLTLRSGIALTTSAFSTSGGSGVLALHVDGALTVEVGASISADGAGYPGGAGGTPRSTVANSGNYGFAGTGIAGPAASVGSAQNFGGGGGGLSYKCGTNNSGDCGGGGGGGAHVGAGGGGVGGRGLRREAQVAPTRARTTGAGTSGRAAAAARRLTPTSSAPTAPRAWPGGPAAGSSSCGPGAIANGGTITARGGAGTAGASGSAEQGGGGAGGGGTVILAGATSAGAVTTSGGAVRTGTLPGGGGGAGRDVAPYALTVDGTLVAGTPATGRTGRWRRTARSTCCARPRGRECTSSIPTAAIRATPTRRPASEERGAGGVAAMLDRRGIGGARPAC